MRHKQFYMTYIGPDPSPYHIHLKRVSIVDGIALNSEVVDIDGKPLDPTSAAWLKRKQYVKIGKYCYRNKKRPAPLNDLYIFIIPETDPAFNTDILLNELYRSTRIWSPKNELKLTRLLEIYLPDFIQEVAD
jgi:hypothetical protein